MNFKPIKWKVIVSIIVAVLWILIANSISYSVDCKLCMPHICDSNYIDYYITHPLCGHCSCHSLKDVIISNLLNIIIPFAIVYIIWSLIQKKVNKKAKKR